MTRLPDARSTPLTLPNVWITSPSRTSCKFASQTAFLKSSSMAANLQKLFHHIALLPDSKRVVELPVQYVQLLVNRMRFRVRLKHFRFDAGHRSLRVRVILVRLADD